MAANQQAAQAPAPAPAHEDYGQEDIHAGGAHQDHAAKHGGTFFMALNGKHHLEGVLLASGQFRLYLYEEFTRPLAPEQMRMADAKVIWGKQDGAPEVALKATANGDALEAMAPAKVVFPLTITLLIRFPGAAPDSRPELFTFPFSHYTHDPATHKH